MSNIEDLNLEIQSSQLQRQSFQELINSLTQEKKQLELEIQGEREKSASLQATIQILNNTT